LLFFFVFLLVGVWICWNPRFFFPLRLYRRRHAPPPPVVERFVFFRLFPQDSLLVSLDWHKTISAKCALPRHSPAFRILNPSLDILFFLPFWFSYFFFFPPPSLFFLGKARVASDRRCMTVCSLEFDQRGLNRNKEHKIRGPGGLALDAMPSLFSSALFSFLDPPPPRGPRLFDCFAAPVPPPHMGPTFMTTPSWTSSLQFFLVFSVTRLYVVLIYRAIDDFLLQKSDASPCAIPPFFPPREAPYEWETAPLARKIHFILFSP